MTDDEKDRALCEAHCNSVADEYFNARPQLDSQVNRRIFYAGHRKAWLQQAEATAPLLARIAELERFKDAYDAWQEKTEWVQTTTTAGELGKHRADVLRERIEKLKSALSAAPAAQPAQHPTAEKDALLRQALEALEDFIRITHDSHGVAGYHLNGNTAEWGEFPEVYHAETAIEVIRKHLGVKSD